MALPIVVKEVDDAPKAPSPTAEEMLAREREERYKLEQRFAVAEAEARARFEMLDRRQYNAQPAMTAADAQKDLGITAEEIAADPDKALKLLSEHIRKETLREVESKYAPIVTGLAEQSYSAQVEALRNRKYAQDLMPLVEEYFQHNPQDRYTPGKAQEVYERLVGKNLDELQRRESARVPDIQKNYSPSRVDEPSMRVGGAPLRVGGESEGSDWSKPFSKEAEEVAYQTWKGLGVIDNRKEWRMIHEGRVFPKDIAADWQPEAERSMDIKRGKVSRGE